MFEALNFPIDHPARDDYDTFTTEEGLVLPAHTSTMQNRILSKIKPPIRAVIPGRVFRNEDVDVTHEHTFYQVEGLLVDKDINLGHMLGTLKTFLESYFEQKIEYKTQPFYFPFVEPGLEYLIKMPKVLNTSSDEQWLEILGCGMIHPNVLKEAGVDSNQYSGFAWGMGLDRMVMLKYGIDDIRHFHSSRLEFLSKFGLGL
jgi:phenylalanyl-tRNA synthetase alpha chain